MAQNMAISRPMAAGMPRPRVIGIVANNSVRSASTTVKFEALPGADTYIDLAADTVHCATLNGVAIDVSGYDVEAYADEWQASVYYSSSDTSRPPVWMGATFGVGQLAAAGVLYLNLERPLHAPEPGARRSRG